MKIEKAVKPILNFVKKSNGKVREVLSSKNVVDQQGR
jgi:hypothetical protein